MQVDDHSIGETQSVPAEMRALARLGFPIVISLAAATLIGVVDTVMIAPLGTLSLAAASITTFVLIIFYSGLYGFVSAIGVRMAEARGKNDATDLSVATRTGLWIAAVTGGIGALLMLALRPALPFLGQPPEVVALISGYWTAMSLLLIPFTVFYALKGLFDAIDAPWVGVILAFTAVALNIPANWVLIHGIGNWEGFGLLGAGLASLFSQTAALVIAWIIWQRSVLTKDARAPGHPTRAEVRTQLREGATIATGYIGEGGAYSFAGLMMGWFSAAALAANQIVNAVGGVLYMVPLGVSIAVSIRIGQAIGADQRKRLKTIGYAALAVIIAWMTLVMLGLLWGGGRLAALLSDDPAVVTLATGMFIVIAAMQVADGVQGTMLGAARGMTDNVVPVAITMVCYWVVALPVGYLLGFTLGWGPNGVWIGYGVGLALAAIAVTLRFFARAGR
ncbi:MATE family efflux transporter [Yoonia litorea]|uniref:Multidrug resistance protein, MATE family n=1 Tax=Yoonia litorea TaxID=1123755 RepID=A0A1I6N1K6_9RHOB|nr:MATE family efflux transporter [Yoonia litorea]SFS21826.1 multidrug resistance protein, MATE family [Yoonia litorea]